MMLLFVHPVDSNDSLYGGDSKFLAENSKLCEAVMAQILEHLKTLAKDEVGASHTLWKPHSRADTKWSIAEGKQIRRNHGSQYFRTLALAILCLHSSASPTPDFSSLQPLSLGIFRCFFLSLSRFFSLSSSSASRTFLIEAAA